MRKKTKSVTGMEDKEVIEKLMRMRGHVRGAAIKIDGQYIRELKGEEGIKAVEEETRRMGSPIKYDKILNMGEYPCGLRVVSLLAVKRAFNWSDEQIMEMGRSGPKFSFIAKLMLRYFISPEAVVKRIPQYWRRYWSVGSMEGEFHEDERYVVIRLKDIELHPIHCVYVSGYFKGVAEMIKKFKRVTVEKVKCRCRGHEYCEWVVRWED